MPEGLSETVLHEWHKARATMSPFGGFEMPISYNEQRGGTGTLFEHRSTRKNAGLFDISHMGRFFVSGEGAVPFLNHVLTNNALALRKGEAQYTVIPDEKGNAIDDAYLYRLDKKQFLLVVNASNRAKDLGWLRENAKKFDVGLVDRSEEVQMFALQGPNSQRVLEQIVSSGELPENKRNMVSTASFEGTELVIARTGYTGEPVCFELFMDRAKAASLWDMIYEIGEQHGFVAVGLGARDTLRLESALPLYGHEFGKGPDGKDIPVFSVPIGRMATRFENSKGDFIGREALWEQYLEVQGWKRGVFKGMEERAVPYALMPIAILNQNKDGPGRNPPRNGYKVWNGSSHIGYVTSGTCVPFWEITTRGMISEITENNNTRAIGLALVDPAIDPRDYGVNVDIEIRNNKVPAVVGVPNMRVAAPYVRPVIHPEVHRNYHMLSSSDRLEAVKTVITQAANERNRRHTETFNLIASESMLSPHAALLSIADPGRYAENSRILAFDRNQPVAYYQGTDFILEVQAKFEASMREYLGCRNVEARPISGQQANLVLYKALTEYVNRGEKGEARRLRALAHDLMMGGHLSAQLRGELKNFIARDPASGRYCIDAFPVRKDNPFEIDLDKTSDLIHELASISWLDLIILGKSMTLGPEPVRQIIEIVSGLKHRPVVMYDGSHVMGLFGSNFQEPFNEGIDFVTGSIHKTFFGTQRGIVASNIVEGDYLSPLWSAVEKGAFPGSSSNHHPGTLLGAYVAAQEMLAFRAGYQPLVLSNAKAYARGLIEEGVKVEGNPSVGYTQSHQVIINVGKNRGPYFARVLEDNNIITSSQGIDRDAGFSDGSCIRTGTQEMTRWGMNNGDFETLAGYTAEALKGKNVAGEITKFRRQFTELRFCFPSEILEPLAEQLFAFYNLTLPSQ